MYVFIIEEGQSLDVFVFEIHFEPVQQMFLSSLFNVFHTSFSCYCAGRGEILCILSKITGAIYYS